MIQKAKLKYNRLIRLTRKNSSIDFYWPVDIDSYGVVTVGEWGGYQLQIHPMPYGDRLVMAPLRAALTYDHGWDYPKGARAILAAMAWDPQRKAEPDGHLRRIGPMRIAGAHHASALAKISDDLTRPDWPALNEILLKHEMANKGKPNGG